jgi:hypothetical protein
MVISRSKHTEKSRIPQGSAEKPAQPNKINANTPFDFQGHADSAIMPTLANLLFCPPLLALHSGLYRSA